MTLLEIQRQMADAVLRPLTGGDRIDPKTNAAFIKPNERLTSLERLEIYSRSYWFRVLDSLYEDFPGVAAVLGKRAFGRLSRAYLTECPSRSFTLRDLGSRLADWLARHPEYAGETRGLARDMAALEWAHIEAFDGAEGSVLGAEDLLELGPDFRVEPQPCIRLLELQYPVDVLRIRVNGADERQLRNLTRSAARLKPERLFLAVHRQAFAVYYRRLAAGEYRLLGALRAGKPIGLAVHKAFAYENDVASSDEQTAMIEEWFGAWAALGWLCRPAKAKEQRTF